MQRAIWRNYDCNDRTFRMEAAPDCPVYQVHRMKGGISFCENAGALSTLSGNAYKLYMHMIMKAENQIWFRNEKQIRNGTLLSAEEQQAAWDELLTTGYLTPGVVSVRDKTYKTHAFHLWETPRMSPTYSITAMP